MKKLFILLFSILTISMFPCCGGSGSGSDDDPGTAEGTGPDAPGAAEIMPGDSKLSLSWYAVDDADSYEVWYAESEDSAEAEQSGSEIYNTYYTITGLTNGTTYYVWLKAKNSEGTSGFSEPATGMAQIPEDDPAAPAYIAIVEGNEQLAVYWAPVEGAEEYEIWSSKLAVFATAEKTAENITGTSYTITGLQNGFNYYIWMRARNYWGISEFSEMSEKCIPHAPSIPAEPDAPYLVPGNNELGVFWNTVEEAASYEVWYNTTDDSGSSVQAGEDISGLGYIVTGLINGSEYYVWLKAKNSAGTSSFSDSSSSIPEETLTFETASSFGDKVNMTIGNEPAVMVYANSSTEDIVFPMGTDDSSTGTVSQRFFMSETEVTFAALVEVLQWAYDNGKLTDEIGKHNSVDIVYVRWGGEIIVSMGWSVYRDPRIKFRGGKFTVISGYEEYPAEHINWYGAIMLCNWLTEMRDGNTDNVVYSIGTEWPHSSVIIDMEDRTKTGYRLPANEEWEFAARWAGNDAGGRTDLVSLNENNPNSLVITGGYYWSPGNYASGATADYTDEDATNAVSWNKYNSNDAQTVESKLPNALGIYDMSGNLCELTFTINVNNRNRVCNRGGSYDDSAELQSGYEVENHAFCYSSSLGFRICRSVE